MLLALAGAPYALLASAQRASNEKERMGAIVRKERRGGAQDRADANEESTYLLVLI